VVINILRIENQISKYYIKDEKSIPLNFELIQFFKEFNIPFIVLLNKIDKVSIFDKCNMQPDDFENPNPPPYGQIVMDVFYIGDSGTDNSDPKDDGEEYVSDINSVLKYKVNKYEDSPHEDLYEIDTSTGGSFILDFYENWKDEGAEFVSGIVEAHFVDLFNYDEVESNDVLDADEDTVNAFNGYSKFPSITGNDNDYVSCKEVYNYMKLWHLGFRYGLYPWNDDPQIAYTHLETGNNYLF